MKSSKAISQLAKKYNLRMIVLFGSHAQKRAHAQSDVDLAIVADRRLTIKQELALRLALHSMFKKEIDLVFLPHVSPLVLEQIFKNGELIFGNPQEFINYSIYARKQYIDYNLTVSKLISAT